MTLELRQPIRIVEWLGLNTRDADLHIRDSEVADIQNVEFFKQGWVVRNGMSKLHTAALGSAAITGIFDGWNHILLYEGTNLRRWDGTTFATITGATGLVNGAVPQFVSYNALDIMVNGSGNDAPQKWDGTTFGALGGSPPKAGSIEVWRNHIFLADLASPNQGEVRYSAIEDPEVWDSGGFLRPSKRTKGHEIVAVKACPYPGEEDGTRLVVFAADAIFQFDGWNKSLFQIYTVKPRLGCISARSIVVAEDLVYWVDENGIFCSPDGGQTVNQITWNIQPTFDGLNKSRLSLSCGVHFRYKRQIWWSFSDGSSSTHNKILVYNYGLSTPMLPPWAEGARHVWSVYTGMNLMSMAEILSSGQYLVYGGESNAASSNGFAYKLDDGTNDAGAAIAWRIKGKRYLIRSEQAPMGSWSTRHVLRKFTFVRDTLAGSTAKVSLFKDAEQVASDEQVVTLREPVGGVLGAFVLDTDVLGGAAAQPQDIGYNQMVSACQIQMSGGDLNKLPRCYEWAIETRPLAGFR